ncbi:MAG: FHA domain-containing protein, partial [Pseudoxanthomonas sp.]
GSPAGSMVNGVAVRDALLAAGDQVAFGSQHRFVLEVPWQEASSEARELADDSGRDGTGEALAPANKHSMKRWPWLLLAALFLAALLSVLLLFGAG